MSIAQRTSRFARTGPAPHPVPPALRRVATAGLAAAAVSLAADLVLVAVPAGPVVILMLMHLAIAAITYVALLTIAPVRGGAR